MDRRLIAQWEAERLPEREREHKYRIVEYALNLYTLEQEQDNPTPYSECLYQSYALLKKPEIE